MKTSPFQLTNACAPPNLNYNFCVRLIF